MNQNRRHRTTRWTRRGMALAAASAVVLLAPDAAHAATAGWSGTLYPGAPRQCIGATARTRARVDGTATGAGARFVVLRDGAQLMETSGTTSGYAAVFTGPGFYQLCARNPQDAPAATFAVTGLRTDADAG